MAFFALLLNFSLCVFLSLSNASDAVPTDSLEELPSLGPVVRRSDALQSLTLNIIVNSSAASLVRRQKLNVLVSKGFGASEESFNTVWIHESFERLQAGTIRYKWVEQYRATFTSKVELRGIIRTQDTVQSPDFTLGQSVSFDGAFWRRPLSNLDESTIGVTYDVTTNPLHPVLLSAYTNSRGIRKYEPFYYGDDIELSGTTLQGQPQIRLQIQLNARIRESAFIGNVMGDRLNVDYRGETEATVCVFSVKSKVQLRSGQC